MIRSAESPICPRTECSCSAQGALVHLPGQQSSAGVPSSLEASRTWPTYDVRPTRNAIALPSTSAALARDAAKKPHQRVLLLVAGRIVARAIECPSRKTAASATLQRLALSLQVLERLPLESSVQTSRNLSPADDVFRLLRTIENRSQRARVIALKMVAQAVA